MFMDTKMMTDLQQTSEDALEEEESEEEEDGGDMTSAYSVDDLMGALEMEDNISVTNDQSEPCKLRQEKDETICLTKGIITDEVIRVKVNDVIASQKELNDAGMCAITKNSCAQNDLINKLQYDDNATYENTGDIEEMGAPIQDGFEIYENVGPNCDQEGADGYYEEGGWSSSEFEDYDEDNASGEASQGSHSVHSDTVRQEENGIQIKEDEIGGAKLLRTTGGAEKKINMKRAKLGRLSWRKSRSTSATGEQPSAMAAASGYASVMFDRLSRLGQKSRRDDVDQEKEEEDCPVLELDPDLFEFPLLELSSPPDDLSSLQLKRRHVVVSIIDSERSYTASLQKILQEYEQELLDSKPQIISGNSIRCIFYKVRDILQCHKLFQMELAEVVRVWDSEEKIGDVFTASFSKSIVFEVYSSFVNNFTTAMEMAKKQARDKQTFAAFLKQKLEVSTDRLSLFGLMVKPVQRFPQFIMLLQDLLKYTPKDHHDRMSLQLALTELDTLTQRLNETKRDSDCRRDAKVILGSIIGRHSNKLECEAHMIRQDDVHQIKLVNGETKKKKVPTATLR